MSPGWTDEVGRMAEIMLPVKSQEALKRWVQFGIKPGGFLTGVLQNDLAMAVGFADRENMVFLQQHVQFAYNYLPGTCWGSKALFDKWHEEKIRV